MELPHDLRDFKAPSAFALFTEEEASALIAVLLVVAFLADFLGWLK